MDTKDKLMGVALILAGIACFTLGFGFTRRANDINNINNTITPNNTIVKPYDDTKVDIYNDMIEIQIID